MGCNICCPLLLSIRTPDERTCRISFQAYLPPSPVFSKHYGQLKSNLNFSVFVTRSTAPVCGRDASAQPIKILLHEIAAHLGDVGVGQAPGDRTRGAAVADLGAVEAAHAGDSEARGGQEHLFGVRRVEEIDVAFNCWNGELAREIERHLAADA